MSAQKIIHDFANASKIIRQQLRVVVSTIAITLLALNITGMAQNGAAPTMTAGLAATYRNTPHASDYDDSGGNGEVDKFDLFLDFGTIRLGINTMHGLNEDKNPNQRLRSNSFYLVYRARAYDEQSKLDAYLMGGIAMVSSAINEGDEVVYTSDDYGYILGAGATYFFIEPLGFGIQLIRISANGEFGDDTLATGSTQIQMVFLYPF